MTVVANQARRPTPTAKTTARLRTAKRTAADCCCAASADAARSSSNRARSRVRIAEDMPIQKGCNRYAIREVEENARRSFSGTAVARFSREAVGMSVTRLALIVAIPLAILEWILAAQLVSIPPIQPRADAGPSSASMSERAAPHPGPIALDP